MLRVGDVAAYLEAFAPSRLAASWDNVGLLLGDQAAPVERIMICLTVTPETAAEAVDRQASLIVSHHPILFRAVRRLTTATSEGRMLLSLLGGGVAVYCPHTSFDNAREGVNDLIAERLGVWEATPLRPVPGPSSFKIVVFTPEPDLARVSNAIFEAGAGEIGQYRECSFRLPGTGTFFGLESTNPTVGQRGRREEVMEWRLEVVCPAARLEAAIGAMRKAHSYEEPAFDIYPLHTLGKEGEGRLGRLARPTKLHALAELARERLNANSVQIVGDPERLVERIAIVCGAGGEFLDIAIRARADVFLTGELRFHDYLAAQSQGLALLLPGHYATERPGVEQLAKRLAGHWAGIEVWASERETDPVRVLP